MVMDYPVYKFKEDPLNTDCKFTRSWPDYIRDGFIGKKIIRLDIWLSWNDLFDMYLEHKKSIDSFIGGEYVHADPSPRDLLNLAGDLASYGLIDDTY